MYPIKLSQTAQPLVFLMVSSTDHVTGVASITPTVTIRKAGGSFASPAGAVTEIANGWYQVAGNATDSNTLGPLLLHATGTGADPTDELYQVVAFDPQAATNLGLTNLDVASSTVKAKTDLIPAAFPTNFASLVISSGGLVSIDVAQTGWTVRDTSAVADAALTTSDLLVGAFAGGVGDKSVVSTAFTVKTPAGTTVAVKTLDDDTTPTTLT